MSTYLKQLIRQGEHQELDFKFGITDSKKIARSLSAFSNTHGGRLLIGVKDNGSISGIKTEEEYYMLEAAASLYCRPEICFEARKWLIDGKTVLEVIISEAKEKPVLAPSEQGKWEAFVRVSDQNLLAGGVSHKVWEKDKRKKGLSISCNPAQLSLTNWLKNHPWISLPQFCRLATLTVENAEEILSDLVVLKVLEMDITEKQVRYRLHPSQEKLPKK